jgi:hypothetical protein
MESVFREVTESIEGHLAGQVDIAKLAPRHPLRNPKLRVIE